jgi:histidinol-phosphate aminotransferase
MYPVYGRMFGSKIKQIPYGGDFNLPYERLLSLITRKTRLVVIVNPNNPTGSALSMEQLDGIIRKCEEEDVLITVDEAYFYYHLDTVIQQVMHRKNLIVLRTFSKLCSLAAARIGYAAASPEIISNLNKVKPSFDVNGFAAAFAEKLLDHPEVIRASLQRIQEGREFLVSELSGAEIRFQNGKGNFLLIHCPGCVGGVVTALKKRKILVKGGFEQPFLRDYIRVTIGSIEQMKKFWNVFKDVMDS